MCNPIQDGACKCQVVSNSDNDDALAVAIDNNKQL